MESGGIGVGEGGGGDCCGRLTLSESLVMLSDDNDAVVTFSDPHAASNITSDRHNRPHRIFLLKHQSFLLYTPLFLNALQCSILCFYVFLASLNLVLSVHGRCKETASKHG